MDLFLKGQKETPGGLLAASFRCKEKLKGALKVSGGRWCFCFLNHFQMGGLYGLIPHYFQPSL